MAREREYKVSLIIVIIAVSVLCTTTVMAASLGGVTSKKLGSWVKTQTAPAPTSLATEAFGGLNGTNLAGSLTDTGGLPWTAVGCAWTVQTSQADTGNGQCTLAVNGGSPYRAVQAAVTRGGATWDGGVIIASNAAATRFISVEWTSAGGGTLEVWSYNGGWASLGNFPAPSASATAIVRAEMPAPLAPATTSVIEISFNNVVVGILELSAANQTLFTAAGQTYFGLIAYTDTNTKFDNFVLETT